MTESDTRDQLIGDRLAELLALIQEVDSVELKLTVPDSQRRSVVEALEMDPLESRGVDLSGVQQTKTRTALELFTRELAGQTEE